MDYRTNNKMEYKKAEVELVLFDNTDSIETTKTPCGGPCSYGSGSGKTWGPWGC